MSFKLKLFLLIFLISTGLLLILIYSVTEYILFGNVQGSKLHIHEQKLKKRYKEENK